MVERTLPLLFSQLLNELFEDNNIENNISFGLWNGQLILENLQLKKNIFDDEKAPISLSFGSISKIEIKIPWNNLNNETIKINIENIFILCKPKYTRDTMDMKLRREHRIKRTKLKK